MSRESGLSSRAATLAVSALLVVTAGCFSAPIGTPQPAATTASPQSTATADGAAAEDGTETLADLDELYRRTIDSVVKIRVVTTSGRSVIGSGFVYDRKGRIITNQHVVENAAVVMVRFRDGQWRRGDVIGTDVYTDLAVVDVDRPPAIVEPLPVAERNVQAGDPVVALGSPFGLEGSITHGIVSSVNRTMPTSLGFSLPDAIQTDAPINPGNSGGPLLSLEGAVVGVNRATRGDNVGFAISADVVERVVPRLIETGTFQYPYLGVRTATVTPIVAAANDLQNVTGVIVTKHLPDSPALGELRAAETRYTDYGRAVPVNGDVILRINGREIETKQQLARYLLLHTRPGDTVRLLVLRDGARTIVTVELGRRPEYPGP